MPILHLLFLDTQINFFFMDSETFEEIACSDKIVGDRVDWLVEGSEVTLIYFNDKVIEVMVPSPAVYEIVTCDPNVKGNSAQGVTKPATLSCGAVINVPGFVDQGSFIKVDTDKGEYMERMK
jgi:elongation factor P